MVSPDPKAWSYYISVIGELMWTDAQEVLSLPTSREKEAGWSC